MSVTNTQASSFSASYKQTPKFKSFLLKEHINEGSRWPDNKSADNNSGDSNSAGYNQTKPVDYSCVLEKERNQQINTLIDYSSMPPLVAIDHSVVRHQGSKAISSQIPLKKRSKQYEGLWSPTSVGDLPLSPVTLPESPQSLSLLEDSDNDKSTELTHSTQQLDNSSDSFLRGSTGKLTDLSITNHNIVDPFYSPTSPGNPSQQYIYSYLQYPPSSYTRNIEYPVAVPPLQNSHRTQYTVNHSNYNPKPTKVNQYFFPLGGPTPSRKVAEELKATQLALFRDSYRLSASSPHAFAPYRNPINTSMDRFKDMSHFRTENPLSQPSQALKDEIFDLNNSTYNVCHEPNRPYLLPQRPSAFKKSLPSFLDPECSSSHPKTHVNREKAEPSNDFMRQKPISEWTFSEVVTFMSRKQDTMNMKFNFTPLSGITGRELLSFSPDKLNVVAPGHGKELFIVLRDLHLERRNSVSDSPRSPYETNSLIDDISKPIHYNIQNKIVQRNCMTSRDNLHPDFMVRSPHEYKQSVSLENVQSPHEYNQRERLENVQIANDYKQRESVNSLHSPQEYKPREILENVQIPIDYKQRESLDILRSPRESFENLRSPRENFESLRSPLEYKPGDIIENVKSSQDDRHNYLRYPYDILGSNEMYKDMKCSPSSTHMSNHYPETSREGYQVPLEQYKLPISSASGSHQGSHQSSHQMPSAARKYFAPLHSPEYSPLNISSAENRPSGDGEVPKTTPVPPVKRGPGRPRKPENELKRKKKRTGRLWEFVRNLLHDPETCPSLVKWENAEEGIFRFVQAEKVAKIWGMRKHNTDMNYEKLSRAMRYYYKGGVFEIVAGRRLVYKFGPAAKNWQPSDPNFPNFQR